MPNHQTIGSAALKDVPPAQEPTAAPQPSVETQAPPASTGPRAKHAKHAKPRLRPLGRSAPAVLAAGVVIAVVLMLVSYAQLVVANDEVVDLRGQLSQLQDENSKLKAQYELAYDLQEIEKQLLATGQVNKIQAWQTYTLDLAEPDAVEYYRSSDLLGKLIAFAKSFATAVVAYF